MTSGADLPKDSSRSAPVSRELATRLINSLRNGSNSLEGVKSFSAGREKVMEAAESLMDDLSYSGGSAVRWLKGTYGSGKTHLFARLLEAAHERRWLVTYVQISTRSQGCELHRFDEVYSNIIRNCVTPEQAHATKAVTAQGATNGWEVVLDDWVEALKRSVGVRDGGDIPTLRLIEAVDIAISQLRTQHGIQGSFSAALRGYAVAKANGDSERVEVYVDWFAGMDIFKRGLDSRKALQNSGVLEVISRRNAKGMLRQVTAFARYRGYKGVLVLFDEVENVLQLTPTSRRTAYTLLRELIDNVDERHGMAQTLVYVSGTPDLFEGDKGIAEYEALASRVILPSSHSAPNPAAAVIDLAAFPITKADFVRIGVKIGKLYAVARHDEEPDERVLERLIGAILPNEPLPSPRLWVRTVINRLDEQGA